MEQSNPKRPRRMEASKRRQARRKGKLAAEKEQAELNMVALKVMDLVLPEHLPVSDIQELRNIRETCQSFKALVDKELDRRIVHDIIPACPLESQFRPRYEPCVLTTRLLHVRDTACANWEGLIEKGMHYAQPDTLDYESELREFEEPPFMDTQLAEQAETCLRTTGKLKVTDFLRKDTTDSHDDDEETNFWDFAGIWWSVEIDKPKEISKDEFMESEECNDKLQHRIDLTRSRERHLGDPDPNVIYNIRDYAWILLCRSEPSSFHENHFRMDFHHDGRSLRTEENSTCFQFSTLDDRNFCLLLDYSYEGEL